MGQVTFTVEGLAAFYRKEGNNSWTIVFPTDKCHKIKFQYIKNGNLSDSIDLADAESIKFTAVKSNQPDESAYIDQKFRDEVIDFGREYLFNEEVKFNRHANYKAISIMDAKLTSKSIQGGRLNFYFPSDKPEDIKLIKDKNGNPQQFCRVIEGKVDIENDGNIKIEIEIKKDDYVGIYSIILLAGDKFVIDNDCKNEKLEAIDNDFRYYSDVFPSVSGRKVELISIFNPIPPIGSPSAATKPPPRVCNPIIIPPGNIVH
jgi:hypothetical protein